MTDHLPECLIWDVKICMCICLELRACEKRMLDDDVFSAAYHGQKGYDIGYAAAIDRAVQRVEEEAAMWNKQTLTRLGIGIALAAINKGQP